MNGRSGRDGWVKQNQGKVWGWVHARKQGRKGPRVGECVREREDLLERNIGVRKGKEMFEGNVER